MKDKVMEVRDGEESVFAMSSPKNIEDILNVFEFPRSAQFKTSSLPLRKAIFGAFKGRCFYTGRGVSFDNMVIDHIVPESRGGPDNIFNYVLTYQEVNVKKSFKFDPVSAVGALTLVRLYYAPLVIKGMENANRPRKKGRRRAPRKTATAVDNTTHSLELCFDKWNFTLDFKRQKDYAATRSLVAEHKNLFEKEFAGHCATEVEVVDTLAGATRTMPMIRFEPLSIIFLSTLSSVLRKVYGSCTISGNGERYSAFCVSGEQLKFQIGGFDVSAKDNFKYIESSFVH